MKLKGKILMTSTVFIILTVLTLFYAQSYVRQKYTDELLNATSISISENSKKQTVARVRATLNYLVDATINPMYFFDLDGVRYVIEPIINDSNIRKVAVFDNESKIFYSSDPTDRYGQKLNNSGLENTVLTNGQIYSNQNTDSLTLAAPLNIQDKILGGVVIIYSLEAVKKEIERNQTLVVELSDANERLFITMNFVVLVTILCISLFFSLGLANRLITPIYQLVAHSKRLEKGKYGIYNSVSSNDELQKLAESINDMDQRLEERTAEIEFMAFHDSLTKIPNRVCFIKFAQAFLEESHQQPQPFAILFIDLDGFKNVNDDYGHQAGDNLLCEVSTRINRTIQKFDPGNIVARVGGDEFLVFLKHINVVSEAENIAQQIIQEVHKPIHLSESSEIVYSSASIGISTFTGDSDIHDPETLIKQADIAMYEAKAKGKGCYIRYTEQLLLANKNADELESNLKAAMTDFSQFQVWYQPKMALQDDSIIGYEALLRWHHPDKGYISPADFIPVAESTGLIIDLGKWVFNRVIEDISRCSDELTFGVSVNVSAKQLRDKDLVHYLRGCMTSFDIDISRLQIEITETALMDNWQVAQESLNELRKLGMEVWLDDFGTGYASLSYLQKLRVDGLKIDRSFISGENVNLTNDTLCSAIISMAKKLDIKVVAEGVETSEQAEFLKREQCDYAQGFYYARPVSFDQLNLQQRSYIA